MAMDHVTKVFTPKSIIYVPRSPGQRKDEGPWDAMQSGTHSALRLASRHKKLVSAVKHLMHESTGRSAYRTGKKHAFKGIK